MPGPKPTVVLLPGLNCDDAVWAAQRAALDDADCVVADYGEIDSLAAMAGSVLAGVAAPRFALAGHSMGGRVALEIARLAPERVERLALLDTGLDPLAPGEPGERERRQRLALLDLARREGMRAMARQWAPGMVHGGRQAAAVFDEVVEMVARSTPRRFAAQIRALLGRPDARAVFAGLRMPVLLACGRHDLWSPLARHEQMRQSLPAARLVVVEDAGHMTTMEQPAAVGALLRDWLRWDPV